MNIMQKKTKFYCVNYEDLITKDKVLMIVASESTAAAKAKVQEQRPSVVVTSVYPYRK